MTIQNAQMKLQFSLCINELTLFLAPQLNLHQKSKLMSETW